jgi:hypothetical protein
MPGRHLVSLPLWFTALALVRARIARFHELARNFRARARAARPIRLASSGGRRFLMEVPFLTASQLHPTAESMLSAGGYDIFAALFTAGGGALWAGRFGDRRHQFLVKGEYGYAGSIVLAGSFHGTIEFGNGALAASRDDGVSEGSEDLFLAVLDESH